MFKKIAPAVVRHSSGFMIFANSRFSIRYLDSEIFAAIPCEDRFGGGVIMYPDKMLTLSYAQMAELSDKNKEIIMGKTKDGLAALSILFEIV